MSFVKVDTSSLIGPALDWAVAKCEGWEADRYMRSPDIRKNACGRVIGIQVPMDREYRWFDPSTDWTQGGPIIEREKITLHYMNNFSAWHAEIGNECEVSRYGPTPLVAAMRCYVASKLGDAIQIPKELLIPEQPE